LDVSSKGARAFTKVRLEGEICLRGKNSHREELGNLGGKKMFE